MHKSQVKGTFESIKGRLGKVSPDTTSRDYKFVMKTDEILYRKILRDGDFDLAAARLNERINQIESMNDTNLDKPVDSLPVSSGSYMQPLKTAADLKNYEYSVLGAYKSLRDACEEVTDKPVYYDRV